MEITVKVNYKNDKLKQRRLAAGLSQAQTAKQAGINLRAYQYYEQGAKDISKASLATILRVCNTLGCSLADVITDQETLEQLAAYKG